jgi:hypothetical protein
VTELGWNTIPDGDDVLAFIARLDAPEHAWVTGVGFVEGAEIVVARGTEDQSVPVPGRTTLVSLVGPRSGPLMAMLARAGADGVKLVGGRLVKARSAGVSLVVEEWRALPSLAAAEPSLVRVAPGGGGGAAGASSASDGDDEADEVPSFGDRVDHFVFGLCDVMVVRGERLKIREVNPPNRLREIHVGPFKVLKPVEVDGKRVFKMLKRT